MTTSTSKLEFVPQEILEHIALCAATQSLVGPPSGLLPLLLTCRSVYQALSFEANPYLYARIFSSKFDARSASRRLGFQINAPRVLANELKKRWLHLKQIRARTHSRLLGHADSSTQPPIDLLWLAYLMMLENDGKNERQLLDYAEMDIWLMEYWFDDDGASSAANTISQDAWFVEDKESALAMWLFWFLLRPESVIPVRNIARLRHMMTIMKLTALAANHYPICHPPWTEFFPRSEAMIPPSLVTHFSETYRLNPPALAPAAILGFFTLALRTLPPTQASYVTGYPFQSPASISLNTRLGRSAEWDTDWYRCLNLGQSDCCGALLERYILGSLEGLWEGIFAYTEFTSYAVMLSGAGPDLLDRCMVARHRQTWKLREYYLAEDQESSRDKSISLGSGDPLKGHFPAGTRFQEISDSVQVQVPGRGVVHYWRPSHPKPDGRKVTDIIILGEGHSAWGQFSLYGRVRPLDGLISFSKEYIHGDRGRWLYRGYLVGNVDGYISGRWRDTLSASNVEGYEGCFAMGRRR